VGNNALTGHQSQVQRKVQLENIAAALKGIMKSTKKITQTEGRKGRTGSILTSCRGRPTLNIMPQRSALFKMTTSDTHNLFYGRLSEQTVWPE
jgi:hypothetical protein